MRREREREKMNSEDINTTVNLSITHIHPKTLQDNTAEPLSLFSLPATIRPALRRHKASLDAQEQSFICLPAEEVPADIYRLCLPHTLRFVVGLFHFPQRCSHMTIAFRATLFFFLGNSIYYLITGVNRVSDGMYWCVLLYVWRL